MATIWVRQLLFKVETKYHTFFLLYNLHLTFPLSTTVNSRAGFLSPIPVVYSSHISYKVWGWGDKAAAILVPTLLCIVLAGPSPILLMSAFSAWSFLVFARWSSDIRLSISCRVPFNDISWYWSTLSWSLNERSFIVPPLASPSTLAAFALPLSFSASTWWIVSTYTSPLCHVYTTGIRRTGFSSGLVAIPIIVL